MKNEIINGGVIWRDSLDKYQEALYYKKQAEKPDCGISARQIKATRERKLDSINVKAKGDISIEELQRRINQIERRSKQYPPTQSVLSELIQLKDELKIREEKDGSAI